MALSSGEYGGRGIRVILKGTINSLDVCQPALATIKAACLLGTIVVDSSARNWFVASVLVYGKIKAHD